jgi:organic radical activating enzyme
MFDLDYVEFYITNVCNLNCDRCNRFNNYAFSGHIDWTTHAEQYLQWSRRVNLNRIGILGGEPLLHPDLYGWVKFVADLWPRSTIMIHSNGTQLHRHPDLLDWLQSWRSRVRIDINRHNADQREATLQNIRSLLREDYIEFRLTTPEQYAQSGSHGTYIDSRNSDRDLPIDPTEFGPEIWADKSFQRVFRHGAVLIRYADANSFDESVVRLDQAQQLYLTSDLSHPELAAAACPCKHSHHFLHGKLYKCGVVAVLPEFLKQFPVQMSPEKTALINSYRAATPDWTDTEMSSFLSGLRQGDAIAQCALCPESFSAKQFAAGTKKIRITKRKDAT